MLVFHFGDHCTWMSKEARRVVSVSKVQNVQRRQCSVTLRVAKGHSSRRQGVAGTVVWGQAQPCGVLEWPALTTSEKKSEIQVCMSIFPFLNVHREVLKYHWGQSTAVGRATQRQSGHVRLHV